MNVRAWSLFAIVMAVLLGQAQAGFAQSPFVAMGFSNETPGALIIQGVSKVNNMPRRGQPILILPGRVAFDTNIPPGVRFINIYDAQQPARVLLADFPILLQNRDVNFSVRLAPGRRDRVILVPE